MYPNAKRGEPLSRVSFAHRNMKSEETELDEKVDMQTKSYIDDIVSAINRDSKMKGLKPIAQKFKDLAMKTGDVAKSLKDVVTKEIGNTSILRGLTARLLNMSEYQINRSLMIQIKR